MDRIAAHGSKNHHQRIEHRLRKLELGSTEPRPLRFVFSASSDDVDWNSQIADMISSGQASADDEFVGIGWVHQASHGLVSHQNACG
jgi:hypothetical protein